MPKDASDKKPSMAENYKTLGQKMMESGRKAYKAMTKPTGTKSEDEAERTEAERKAALARRYMNRNRSR